MKYIHLRYRWEEMESPTNPTGIDCRGGVTIGLENGHDTNTVKYAIAYCSLQDVFNRKVGRAIVEGRIQNGDCYETNAEPWDDWHDILNAVILPKIRQKIEHLIIGEESNAYVEALS